MAVCQKDVVQALKLIRWIGFLDERQGGNMKNHNLLVVANHHVSKRFILDHLLFTACRIFGTVRCFVPDGEHEKGWPDSANFMFREAMLHATQMLGEGVFWLEPDCAPITEDWYLRLIEEEESQPLTKFMGGRSTVGGEHMTGIGYYDYEWWKGCGDIVHPPKRVPWDIHAWPMIKQSVKLTPLIQHRWGQSPSLAALDPEAVLYHQDKTGVLINLIDETQYHGACAKHPFLSYNKEHIEPTMRKFFLADNSNRIIKSQGYEFVFESFDNFGGSWRGVYTTEDPGELVALEALTGDPRTAVSETDQEYYERASKKKALMPKEYSLSAPQNSRQVAIKQSPAAVVVQSPLPSPESLTAAPATIQTAEAAVQIGDVTPPVTIQQQPAQIKRRPGRPSKKPEAATALP